ncbi:MAG: hypothetical protein OEY89_10460 [Gammaproteobacteria bacterium]|nr:hypothetical protein [Gammaproteobacteria bacterium]
MITSFSKKTEYIIVLFMMLMMSSCVSHSESKNKSSDFVSSRLYDSGDYIDGGNLLSTSSNTSEYMHLIQPVALAGWLDYIYIADMGHHAILRYNTNTKDIVVFYNVDIGVKTRIHATTSGQLYVTDPVNSRVLYLDNTGRLIREMSDSNLIAPSALVEDERNSRILIVDSIKKYLLEFNHLGRLFNVSNLDFDDDLGSNIISFDVSKNRLYFLDQISRKVVVTDRYFRYICSFGGDTLKLPVLLQSGVDENIFIADSFDNSIILFKVNKNITGLCEFAVVDVLNTDMLKVNDMLLHDFWLYVADSAAARIRIIGFNPD